MLPKKQDIKLLKALVQYLNDVAQTKASRVALAVSLKEGNLFCSLPLYSSGVLKDQHCMMISPIELILGAGSPQQIAEFLTFAPPFSLKDIVLSNLMMMKHQNPEHVSSLYSDAVKYRLSTSLRTHKGLETDEFDDVASFLIPQRHFDRDVEEKDCQKMWQKLLATGVTFEKSHQKMVTEAVKSYLSLNNFHKKPCYVSALLDAVPPMWFSPKSKFAKNLLKEIDFVLNWRTEDETQRDGLVFKNKIEQRMLQTATSASLDKKPSLLVQRKM